MDARFPSFKELTEIHSKQVHHMVTWVYLEQSQPEDGCWGAGGQVPDAVEGEHALALNALNLEVQTYIPRHIPVGIWRGTWLTDKYTDVENSRYERLGPVEKKAVRYCNNLATVFHVLHAVRTHHTRPDFITIVSAGFHPVLRMFDDLAVMVYLAVMVSTLCEARRKCLPLDNPTESQRSGIEASAIILNAMDSWMRYVDLTPTQFMSDCPSSWDHYREQQHHVSPEELPQHVKHLFHQRTLNGQGQTPNNASGASVVHQGMKRPSPSKTDPGTLKRPRLQPKSSQGLSSPQILTCEASSTSHQTDVKIERSSPAPSPYTAEPATVKLPRLEPKPPQGLFLPQNLTHEAEPATVKLPRLAPKPAQGLPLPRILTYGGRAPKRDAEIERLVQQHCGEKTNGTSTEPKAKDKTATLEKQAPTPSDSQDLVGRRTTDAPDGGHQMEHGTERDGNVLEGQISSLKDEMMKCFAANLEDTAKLRVELAEMKKGLVQKTQELGEMEKRFAEKNEEFAAYKESQEAQLSELKKQVATLPIIMDSFSGVADILTYAKNKLGYGVLEARPADPS